MCTTHNGALAGPTMVAITRAMPGGGLQLGMLLVCFTFMLSGLIEGITPESGAADVLWHGCKTFGHWVLGLLGVLLLNISASVN